MTNTDAVAILSTGGPGSKDRRAALAAEFFATLDATHGNSAQSKSLQAIADRALVRYNRKVARKAARAAENATENAAEQVESTPEPVVAETPAPKSRKGKRDKASGATSSRVSNYRAMIAADNAEARR